MKVVVSLQQYLHSSISIKQHDNNKHGYILIILLFTLPIIMNTVIHYCYCYYYHLLLLLLIIIEVDFFPSIHP